MRRRPCSEKEVLRVRERGPNYALVSERLRRARKQGNLSLRQVANAIDVSASTLSRVERGTHFLPFVNGEPARIERCALAAKMCFGVLVSQPIDPWQAAENVGIIVHGEEFFATLTDNERHEVFDYGGKHWSAGTILGAG